MISAEVSVVPSRSVASLEDLALSAFPISTARDAFGSADPAGDEDLVGADSAEYAASSSDVDRTSPADVALDNGDSAVFGASTPQTDAAGQARSTPDADVPPPGGENSAAIGDEVAASGRRISSLEEVRDGGYSVGSAAPVTDGAQPLGHAVQAYRDSMTFVTPGDAAYDEREPDVWFYDDHAAEKAGFRHLAS
ncbi:MAG: hypothetical protein ACRCYX_15120 [Dermatophilaceae bacterium]